MATCEVNTPKPQPFTFSLTLTAGEATTLREICNRIGGDARTSRRKHTDAIGVALYGAGVEGCSFKFEHNQSVLHLKDETKEVPE